MERRVRIAMSGASGFIGNYISKRFVENGHEIVSITRQILKDESVLLIILKDCEVVINLAGEKIIKKWTPSYKQMLLDSRIGTTKLIANAIKSMKNPPKVFISSSAIGIYKNGKNHDENSLEFGDNFLVKIVKEWEEEALRICSDETRVVIFRFGVVLGKNGGILKEVLPIFKKGFGGVLGDGKQGFSWIHIEDVYRIFVNIIKDKNKKGIYNITSPYPEDNRVFTKTLGGVLKRPTLCKVPASLLKLKFGESSLMLTQGAKVYPQKLIEEDFSFFYSKLNHALENILDKRRDDE